MPKRIFGYLLFFVCVFVSLWIMAVSQLGTGLSFTISFAIVFMSGWILKRKNLINPWLATFIAYTFLSILSKEITPFAFFLIMELSIYALAKGINKSKTNKLSNKIDELNRKCSNSILTARKTDSVQEFIDNWEILTQVRAELIQYDGKVSGKQELIDSIKNLDENPAGEEYQWLLRNVIERRANKTIKDIKTTYRNSITYQQSEYESFRREMDEQKELYNDETASFVDSKIDELNYALTGERLSSPSVSPDVARERRLMSASLRYDIMKRDGFKCTICGRTQADGVKLHVDHILPVSKGGKTTPSNLRTLCQDCNLGKSDKYDESGEN